MPRRLFTSGKNGRFARTIVNRYWRALMGRGLVEPVDDLDDPAWDADLLDWLAADFADHGYDLQFLLRRIMTSRTYQAMAVDEDPQKDAAFVFRGPLARRLTRGAVHRRHRRRHRRVENLRSPERQAGNLRTPMAVPLRPADTRAGPSRRSQVVTTRD